MESTYKQAFLQIINFMENLEENEDFAYYLVGGILINIYSDFRITRDIDIVIDQNHPTSLFQSIDLIKY